MWPQYSLFEEEGDLGATSAPAVPGVEPTSELDLNDILAMDDTGEYKPESKPVEPKPAAAPVVSPAAPVTPPVQAAPIAPTTPAPAAPAAPYVESPAAEPAAPIQQSEPAQDFAALRQAEHTRLTSAYALSEEDSRMMAVEPERVIPKLAATLHLQVFEAVMHGITNYLPQVIEAQAAQRTTRDAVRNEFFSEFPALKDGKYQRDVEAALVTYRQYNPQGTRAQAITHAGVHVSLAHGIALPEKYFKGMNGAVAPAPGEVRPATPFTPAAPGSSQTPPPPASSNYYAKIAEEDLEY